jgi:Zn-finger protein
MNKKAREWLEKHINNIIKEFNFNARKTKFSYKCPCYKKDKPCHNISGNELNCFLCYCPEYDTTLQEGGCKINNKKGKWFFNESLPNKKIWDCTHCDYPHKITTVRNYLRNFFRQRFYKSRFIQKTNGRR